MAIEAPPRIARRASGAKSRILDTADALFYSEGIRSVGIDRLIAESGVTKATFYKHYGSKERLVLSYIEQRSAVMREYCQRIADEHASPADALRSLFAWAGSVIVEQEFRGSPFVNAAAEFHEPGHPVRLLVAAHRDWFSEFLQNRLQECGHPLSGDGADELLLAWDGAMSGGYAGDSIAAAAALQRALERVLAER
ncbi:TetR/AcrR family transcriptional regulator [Ruicaihuangia caeni]|uniref:TetR/AcrR family transcriptional regulator n=1 Tax=Ruicaihuangia caeni TaxID=3042517 RepID=A0AAW6TB74_9MICO|nr:TetR/AcrR family transcriptional regulator [Klugiella sp. YN-L-19]MDI2099709.1 TetR/AcrR family transcriptional regulator [Klugiella sp. YN-L-19]